MDGSAEIRRKCPKSRLFSLGFRARLTEKVLSDNVLLDAAMRKRVLETTTGMSAVVCEAAASRGVSVLGDGNSIVC